MSLLEKLGLDKEFAPGIPREKRIEPIPKVTEPKVWDVAVQHHLAKKRGCFAAHTPIHTTSGIKVISEIEPGDSVIVSKTVIATVRKVWNNGPGWQWVQVTIGDEEVVCTPDHHFWVSGMGWIPISLMIDLKIKGDHHGRLWVCDEDLSCLRNRIRLWKKKVCGNVQQELRVSSRQQEIWKEISSYPSRGYENFRSNKIALEEKKEKAVPETRRSSVACNEIRTRRTNPSRDRKFDRLLQDVGDDCIPEISYTNSKVSHQAFSGKNQRIECLELEGRNLQWKKAGDKGTQSCPNTAEKIHNRRNWHRDVREMQTSYSASKSGRGSSHCSVSLQPGQWPSELRSFVRQLPCLRRADIQTESLRTVRIARLPRSKRARYDLEIEGIHCYQAGPFLVHNSHFDLRLVDPNSGHAHSWAAENLPTPGESTFVAQQPTHTSDYALGFEGEIPAGYGAGNVRMHLKEKAEVLRADDNKIVFNIYQGKDSNEYALVRMGNGKIWKLINRTPTRETHDIPNSKPKYRETKPESVDVEDSSQIMMPKIDGAHITLNPEKGKDVRAFSYRPTERATGVIEHTRRFGAIQNVKTPQRLSGTVVRGELYAENPKTGKAIDAKDVGALLNSNVLKSREKQKEKGALRAAIFDVVKFKGKPYENVPYKQKLEALREIAATIPGVEVPRVAETPEQKREMLSDIRKGREPSTREGVVLWPVEGGRPTKAKFKEEHDVYIRKIFGGKRAHKKGMAGGFSYSHSPEGKIVGNVGTGFSQRFREDMWENPDKYIGLLAKVHAQEKFPSGALRAPSFDMLHLDNPGDRLMEVEKVALEASGFITEDELLRRAAKAARGAEYIRTKIRAL